jgi:hypothetical protein
MAIIIQASFCHCSGQRITGSDKQTSFSIKGAEAKHFLNLTTRTRWVVTYALAILPRRKQPRYLLDRMLGEPQSQSGHCCEQMNPGLAGIEPRSSAGQSLVTIRTELSHPCVRFILFRTWPNLSYAEQLGMRQTNSVNLLSAGNNRKFASVVHPWCWKPEPISIQTYTIHAHIRTYVNMW